MRVDKTKKRAQKCAIFFVIPKKTDIKYNILLNLTRKCKKFKKY